MKNQSAWIILLLLLLSLNVGCGQSGQLYLAEKQNALPHNTTQAHS